MTTSTSVAPFSVKDDNPFAIFRKLQKIAHESVGSDEVIDLSRGDPGYGFTPSTAGREFASFVLMLDRHLNEDSHHRFGESGHSEDAWNRIQEITNKTYKNEISAHLLSQLESFIKSAQGAAKEEGKNWNQNDVISHLFAHCSMSGGSYLDPKGEELTRVITAAWHRAQYDIALTSDDLLLTRGVSHGIGTLFKALGKEGCKFLTEGDTVLIGSPVYAPYNSIIERRGLKTETFRIDPTTGAISNIPETTKAKALILIDPNNPTGFSFNENSIETLAAIAQQNDMLIITDEVYSAFFEKKKTMLHFAPERTICLNGRSKIERSTGLRSAEIITTPKGREHIAKLIGLGDAEEFEQLLIFSKAPGGTGGQFHHTTFVSGPSQLLSMTHIVLGNDEQKKYVEELRQNGEVFSNELGLSHQGNRYYIVFDLNQVPGCTTQVMPIEEKLIKLAEAGVVYIPACQFFSEEERENQSVLNSVRASVVNTTSERLKEAAKRTKKVLC